jgi:hypothetical protein
VNEAQYQSVCEACDRVLLAEDTRIERVAIPWLHVVREHPVFLVNYFELFATTSVFVHWRHRWMRMLRNAAAWIRQLFRAIRSGSQPWAVSGDIPQHVDYLFVSHLVNAAQINDAQDFYFGTVPFALASQGNSVAIAMINHTGLSTAVIARNSRACTVPKVLLSDTLGLLRDIKAMRRLKRESRALSKNAMLAKRQGHRFLQKVFDRASQEALSNGSITALRIAEQVEMLTRTLQPKVICIIHEGHSWERVAFASARAAVPHIRCVGYQHAALFKLQHAIRRNLHEQYNPDRILTAGMVSMEQLKRTPDLARIPIAVLGSNRAVGQDGGQPGGTAAINACLVIPEGLVGECHLLFEFSIACAKLMPEIRFIWRLHPLQKYETLRARNQNLKNLPSNIELSHGTLEQDIALCRWVIYRGSTAILKAVEMGLRPIYLELPGELTIDPLYELGSWRLKVSHAEQMRQAVAQNTIELDDVLQHEKSLAQAYCAQYFMPVNIDAISSILS